MRKTNNATLMSISLGVGGLCLLVSLAMTPTRVAAAGVPESFQSGNLIDDTSFIALDSMSVADIQNFLTTMGSGLASYRENNRSAAEIIWGAAHGTGDASGTINGITINATTGTVSPKVLLVTLQKEQRLITNPSPSQRELDCAMGYEGGNGCQWMFDNRPQYKGFENQVEWGAWQLRYNYERAQGHSYSDYQVGQGFCWDDSEAGRGTNCGTFGNQATAALYRYTPHVYNGNYNFWQFYRQWFVRYSARLVSRNTNKLTTAHESLFFEVKFKNTGEETWRRNQVFLGPARPFNRTSVFSAGWVAMQEESVPPGSTGTFQFWQTVPATLAVGTYREYFNLVADGITWFDDPDLSWDVTVVPLVDSFQAQLSIRSGNLTVLSGEAGTFVARFTNTGVSTWRKNQVFLGEARPFGRNSVFTQNGAPLGWVAMQEESVPPGGMGTFIVTLTAPSTLARGTYREYFALVADGVTWLTDPDLSWDIYVPS